MPEYIWTRSKWSKDELEFKTVEFRIPIKGGFAHGIGQFYVSPNPEGLLRIELVTDEQGRHWAERIQTRFQLPQPAVDRIEKHPDPKIAEFRIE